MLYSSMEPLSFVIETMLFMDIIKPGVFILLSSNRLQLTTPIKHHDYLSLPVRHTSR